MIAKAKDAKAKSISRHDPIISIVNSGKYFLIDNRHDRVVIFTHIYVWNDGKYYNLAQDDDESYDETGYLQAKKIDPKACLLVKKELIGNIVPTYEEIDSLMDSHEISTCGNTREDFIYNVQRLMMMFFPP